MSFKTGKFGRLTIRRLIAPDIFECDCECGNLLDVWRSLLACGVQRDCGMCRRLQTYKRRSWQTGKVQVVSKLRPNSKHGHQRHWRGRDGKMKRVCTREYNTWAMMIHRCHGKGKAKSSRELQERYADQGIRVCKRWREPDGQGFLNFIHDMGPRPQGKTLDRINPRGHYEPGNCRWADWEVQGINKSRSIWRGQTPPPIEKVREMEARIQEQYADENPY